MGTIKQAKPIYRRILLKMSGEALSDNDTMGINSVVLDRIVQEVSHVTAMGVQVAIVIGGGNLFRGKTLSAAGITRVTGDYMGMLATVMNALALRDAFERAQLPARVLSAIPMTGIVEVYDHLQAIHHLQSKRVVIFSAGTGNPLVTTDSAASLRAIEVQADIVLKGTQVDGVYDCDPRHNPDAKRYERLTFDMALKKELAVMDLAAFCQCRDHNMKIQVFDIHKHGALMRVVTGAQEGTLIERENH
jgi:uridylate kinase